MSIGTGDLAMALVNTYSTGLFTEAEFSKITAICKPMLRYGDNERIQRALAHRASAATVAPTKSAVVPDSKVDPNTDSSKKEKPR